MDSEGLFPEPSNRARLCTRCRKLDFFVPDFLVEDTWADLKETHNVCDFCALRWQVCIEQNLKNTQKITFVAINSMLHLNEHADPVMSICRAPDQVFESKQESKRIKIGFPNLTASCSQHMGLMRQWLEYCDTRHHCKPQANSSVPTRVIDIGTEHEPTVRLCETKPGDSFRYIALSHCWGTEQHFLTTACNLEEHKRGIPIQTLPRTFQHAIQTTRQLGIQYLWIDSICIIQGDHGDFDKEAEKMELVFSSAYCVLAASSARSQQDGFLNPRKARKAVNLVKEGDARGGVYVSLFSDDFKEHVVNSPLSERGWVLQERALARRTIYFTEWQTYWECGDGIRCETLTLMNNNLISFLGDPNFPSKLSDGTSDRGEKIRFYEGLYKQYSRLTLSRDSDRPIAIAGLEKRLIHDLKSSGGFGVFDDERSLLPRSLLWQRGDEFPTLKKIESQVLPRVPTWSWMAYKGGVDYLDPPFGEVAWNISEIRGNWFGKGNRTELSAKTRLFRMTTTTTQDFDITWDIPKDIKPDVVRLKCIVVGVKMQRGVSAETKTHYVLIVRLREYSAGLATEETEIYERVGVGKMLGLYIDLDNSQPRDWVKIR
ncbi:heterokaryon incompatibility protein-domain-containing protein [Sordaria sp. MPI-SDFR-AT-0083]|nr:heterokaryon incompatibility protein-domain-containing protein [Sordaria sp. MPI-SDFR-AT-0083]